MRRPDRRGSSRRSVPFSVPGDESYARRRRSSRQYPATRRQSGDVRSGSSRSGSSRSGASRNSASRSSASHSSASRKSASRSSASRNGASQKSAANSPAVKPARTGLLAGLVFLLIGVIVLVAFVISTTSGSGGKQGSSQTIETAGQVANGVHTVEGASSSGAVSRPVVHSYDIDPADFLAIPASPSVVAVELGGGASSKEPSGIDLSKVQQAVSAIERNGDCGFVFVDLDTGRGLAYNAAEVMYVASAAKAPFIYWLITSGIELDEEDRENVQWTIEDSENEAFESLFFQYYSDDYAKMMDDYGITHEDYTGDFYPKMGARNLASLWAAMYQYTQSGTEDGTWLGKLFGMATTSFIRDGVKGTGATVMNKAGWIGEDEYMSVSDAGIIKEDGHTYLMAIVTAQSDNDADEAHVSALARVLFDLRYSM